jgi:hypothetical protein
MASSAWDFCDANIAYAPCGDLFTSIKNIFDAARDTSGPSSRSTSNSVRFKNDVAPPAVTTRPPSTTTACGASSTRG